jgi:hypothetical protein
MGNELGHRSTEMSLTQRDHPIKTLFRAISTDILHFAARVPVIHVESGCYPAVTVISDTVLPIYLCDDVLDRVQRDDLVQMAVAWRPSCITLPCALIGGRANRFQNRQQVDRVNEETGRCAAQPT